MHWQYPRGTIRRHRTTTNGRVQQPGWISLPVPNYLACVVAQCSPSVSEQDGRLGPVPVIQAVPGGKCADVADSSAKPRPLHRRCRLGSAGNERQVNQFEAEMTADDLRWLRWWGWPEGRLKGRPHCPRRVLKAPAPGQRHAPPSATVEFHEPGLALRVPQKLKHEQAPPADGRQEALARLDQILVDLL